MLEKKELRRTMLSKRKEVDKNQKDIWDKAICEKIDFLIQKDNLFVVHTFIPMEEEINISPLITTLLSRGITVVCPKALPKRKMENLRLKSLTELESGIYGTQHPSNTEEYTGKIDLIIIPGLAFDTNCYRLGYGSGYYDTFLTCQHEALKIGICYPFQVVDKVPTEEHDVRLDMLLYLD